MLNQIIGYPKLLRYLSHQLAVAVKDEISGDFDFIAANTPGGMVPGWQLRSDLEGILQKQVPYVYIRKKKKKGGQKEDITGDQNNPLIEQGDVALIVEQEDDEKVFLEKTIRSANILRDEGYGVRNVATFTSLDGGISIETKEKLIENKLGLITYRVDESLLDDFPIREEHYRPIASIPESDKLLDPEDIAKTIIDAKALEIRDLEGGEEPFLYASGLWGPGYAMIKALVGQPEIMNEFCWQLALRLKDKKIGFVVGNVTGGVVPAYQTRNYLEHLTGNSVPYFYAEGSRLLKAGLTEGKLVGKFPTILRGLKGIDDNGLVFEELVNTAGTTVGAVMRGRQTGHDIKYAATIFHYENPIAIQRLEDYEVTLTHLLTLSETLDIAEEKELFNPRAVQDYRSFIKDPRAYQKKWNLTPVDRGGTE